MAKLKLSDIQILIDYRSDYFDNKFLTEMFGHISHGKGEKAKPPRFKIHDTFVIVPGVLKCVKKEFETTIGCFICNKFVIDGSGLGEFIPYVNAVWNANTIKKIDAKCSELFIDNKIDHETFSTYITNRDTLGSLLIPIVTPSMSMKMITQLPAVIKRREELLKQFAKEIEEGNTVVMNNIETELIALAKDILKDEPGMLFYKTGSRPSFDLNYKVNYITKGPTMNSNTGKFEFLKNNLDEGLSADEFAQHSNAIVNATYPSAIGTAESGYLTKKLMAMMQTLQLDMDKESDCKSKRYMLHTADDAMALENRWSLDNGKLIKLTKDNIDKYRGKKLPFRSPLYCTSKKICSKCAGDLFYKLGSHQIGLTAIAISGQLLNSKTKAKHSSKVDLIKISTEDLS